MNLHHQEAREKILEILGSQVSFEGHFDSCFDALKESQQQALVDWVKVCNDWKIDSIKSKKYNELLGFVKRIGSNLRAILTKKKEGYFLVLFLDKHKYYEIEMERLGF